MTGALVRSIWAALAATLAIPCAAAPSFVGRGADLPVHQSYEGGWPHFVGGGVAVLDCDDDGLPDFYAAGGAASSRLFRNVTVPGDRISFEEAEIADLSGVTGAYPLDIDSDGLLDLVVLRHGANALLRGRGNCRFEPAPAEWQFDGGDAWTTAFSATFEAGQNWPTLAFGNYVDLKDPDGPFEACDDNMLLRPDGRRFDAPEAVSPGYCALSMLVSDWQRNGTPDLRISNDRQYYVRDGREQMWRLSPLSEYTLDDGWPDMKLWGMGIASRDITGDGLPEVVLTSMGDQILQLNMGGGNMQNVPYDIGSYATTPYIGDDGRPSTGWHAAFADVDNDGLNDLFIAKGNVDQMPGNAMEDPNNLLMQQSDGSFVEVGDVAGIGTTARSRGAALVDLNRDGRLDIIVVNRRAPLEIWENTTENTGNWLAADPRQSGTNSRAVGAFVELRMPSGRVLTREITVGGGHASGSAVPLHFGLGDAERAGMRVIWPDGEVSDWVEVDVNATLRVMAGEGAGLEVVEAR